MPDSGSYRVKVEGPGLTLEREIPAQVGEQIVVLILGGETVSAGLAKANTGESLVTTRLPPKALSGGGAPSLREYLDEHKPARSPDKITAIGCFLKDYRSKPSFTKSELQACFEEAAEPVPKNIPRDLKWTIRVGWVAPKADEKDAYYVTARGIDVVQKKFPAELRKKTLLVPSTRKRANKKPAAET